MSATGIAPRSGLVLFSVLTALAPSAAMPTSATVITPPQNSANVDKPLARDLPAYFLLFIVASPLPCQSKMRTWIALPWLIAEIDNSFENPLAFTTTLLSPLSRTVIVTALP